MAELKVKLTAETKQATADVQRFGKAVTEAGNKMPQLAKSTAGANVALVNFGRVVQDAPFGLIGIANNIDPLISSFQNLKQQTGSTGGALKALAAGLTGPAGIAIAISAVTSALIAFGPQIKNLVNGISQAEAEQQKLNEEFGKEKAELGALESAFNATNATRAQKLAIIKELRSNYGGYLKDLTDEQILQQGIGKAIELSTQAIENRLRASAFEVNAAKSITEQLNTRLEIERVSKQIEDEKLKQSQQAAQAEKSRGKAAELSAANALGSGLSIVRLQKQRNDLLQKDLELQADIGKQLKAAGELRLPDFFEKAINANAVASKKLLETQKELRANQTNLNPALVTPEARQQPAAIIDFPQTLDELEKINNVVTDIGQTSFGKVLLPAIQAANLKTQQTLDIFNAFTPAIDQAFNALANGEDPFKALQQSVKRLIVDLLKAAAIALALSAISGGAASATGLPKLLGGLLKLPGFARGGVTFGPTPALVGEGGPEAIIPLSQLANIIGNIGQVGSPVLVTGNIRGNDLYITNQRGGASYSRLFG